MSEGEKTEFGTSLVLDDHATEALHKIREGFEGVGEKIHEVEHEIAGFAKQALATAVGFDLSRGLDSIKEMGEEFFKASRGEEENVKGLAGVLAMSDKTGKSMLDLREDAKELHDNLVGMGTDFGVSGGTMVDLFETIASRSKKSSEQIKEMVGQVAQAGKAVPGGATAIANAYRDLESGIVRPKNAIVQMIKQSGLAGGSARDIAKGLQKMMETNPAKVFELADKAIGRMSDKMKNVPLTFDQTVESLKNVREELFAAAGEPMVKALTGPLSQLREYFKANKEHFAKLAKELGEHVGEWIKEAATKIEEGFHYLETHAEEIKKAIQDGFTTAKEVVQFILAHKEAIAIAFGAKTVIPGAMGAARGIGTGIDLMKGLGSGGVGMLGGTGAAGAAGGLAGAAMLAGAAAAAAAAWAGVYDQTMKLHAETGGFKSGKETDFDAKIAKMREMSAQTGALTDDQIKDWNRFSLEVRGMGDVAGMNSAAIGQMVDQMWSQHTATRAQYDALDKLSEQGDGLALAGIVQAYNQAEKEGDKAKEAYIAKMLEKDAMLRSAFERAGDTLEGGFAHLISLLSTKVGQGLADTHEANQPKVKGDAITNFNGGQTFHIKQDFKDGDPDRMILAFKKDFLASVQNRRNSKLAGSFGF